jgi:hypothetical protein
MGDLEKIKIQIDELIKPFKDELRNYSKLKNTILGQRAWILFLTDVKLRFADAYDVFANGLVKSGDIDGTEAKQLGQEYLSQLHHHSNE